MLGGASIAAVMTVPEATVHKYSDLLLREYEIGMTFYLVVSPPARNPIQLEYCDQAQFCRLILFRLDLTHNLRSLFLIEDISHSASPGFKLF